MIFEKTCQDYIEDCDEDIELLFILNNKLENKNDSNSKFVKDILEVFYKNEKITGKQYNVLVDIYEKLGEKMNLIEDSE